MPSARPAVPTVPPPHSPHAPHSALRVLCPYCGEVSADPRRCDACRGFFDPLSRQATQNAMGPWFIREDVSPWRPGCSIETLRELIRRGKVTRDTVIRGPGTKQFWNFAGRTPSIANLLGLCHNCRSQVKPDDYSCKVCGAVFSPDPDRQHLGLAPVHILPGEASPEIVAAASMETPEPVPVATAPLSSVPAGLLPEPARPIPAREPSRAPGPSPKRSASLGPWLVAATVLIVGAMGTVFALVATGTISIPWLTAPTAAPTTAKPVGPSVHGEPPSTGAPGGTASSPPESPAVPGPSSAPTQPLAPDPEAASINLDSLLLPLLNAEPFDEAALLSRIEALRAEHPSLGKALDAWAVTAKSKADRIRLRRIP